MTAVAGPDHVPFVFVTGLIRSGTTWIGKLLASGLHTLYVHEPFNPGSLWNQALPTPAHHLYLNRLNGGPWIYPFQRILSLDPLLHGETREEAGRLLHEFIERNEETRGPRDTLRPVVKDPTALFLSEWLVETFGTRPVVVLRHPVSITKSLLRLGWSTFDPSLFLNQPLLLERFFGPDEVARLEAWRRGPEPDEVTRAALLVAWLYKAVVTYRRDHPDWVYVSYEELLRDPGTGAARLFEQTGLEPSQATREALGAGGAPEYDPAAPHQRTIRPIASRLDDIWAPTEHARDWRAIHAEHFAAVEEGLGGLVRWT
jgi:hypothetical protein